MVVVYAHPLSIFHSAIFSMAIFSRYRNRKKKLYKIAITQPAIYIPLETWTPSAWPYIQIKDKYVSSIVLYNPPVILI